MKGPKTLDALKLAEVRKPVRAADSDAARKSPVDTGAHSQLFTQTPAAPPASPAKVAPVLAGSARKTAASLKEQVKGFDLRQTVNDLKRVPESAIAAPPAVVMAPVAVEPRPRGRAASGRAWSRWTFLLGCLCSAGVAHIVTIFALPVIGSTSAYERLKPQLPVNAMAVLPPAAPGTTHIPFLSPDMRYAMCRYDISSGPVAVSAVLPEAGWSLAIHAPDGENFYLVPGQDQRRTEIAFTITRTSERSLIATPGVRRSDVDATQVTSPRADGLVVLRAPVRGTAYRAETEAILKAASCRAIVR
jgi:uncharacterized membrane protein